MHFNELETFYKKSLNINLNNDFTHIKNAEESKVPEMLTAMTQHIAQKHPKYKEQPQQVFFSIGSELATAYRFWLAGKKIYKLTDNITQILALKDVKDISFKMISLSFDTIYLEFPSTLCPKGIENERILGLYIQLHTNEDKTEKYLTIKFLHAFKHLKEQVDPSFTSLLGGDITLTIKDDSHIIEQIAIQIQRSPIPLEKKSLQKIIDFVLNTVMYINSEKADIQFIKKSNDDNTSKKKKNKYKLNVDHFLIGNNITLDDNILKITYIGEITQ